MRELGDDGILQLSLEEQYLVASGQTYFRDLAFDDLHRLQFDLETTGLDPALDRIFLVAVRDNRGLEEVLHVLIPARESCQRRSRRPTSFAVLPTLIRRVDPDVLENHNHPGLRPAVSRPAGRDPPGRSWRSAEPAYLACSGARFTRLRPRSWRAGSRDRRLAGA